MGLRVRMVLVVVCSSCASACWLEHEDDPPPPEGDADADVDADTDADGDADPPERPDDAVRPELVCGLDALRVGTGGTLRVLEYGCVVEPSCEVAVVDATLDLRPRATPADCDRDGPIWFDCEAPAGSYGSISVWGENVPVACLGNINGGNGDCEAHPQCVELSPEPLPADCTREPAPMYVDRFCAAEVVEAGGRAELTFSSECGCGTQVNGGCWFEESDRGLVVRPLVASCGRCSDEDVCWSVETSCNLYDLPVGEVEVTAGRASCEDFSLTLVADHDGPWSDEPRCAACF